MTIKLDVYKMDGKKSGKVELDKSLFDGKVNKALLWEVKRMHEANLRRGTASAKGRGELRGGGKRPYAQKGTGRARHASVRSPIWRGGGVVFGPKPRDFSYSMPKKKKIRALLSALNARLTENNIKVLEDFNLKEIKTKKINEILGNLGLRGSKTLIVDGGFSDEAKLSTRNLKKVTLSVGNDLNAYSVILHKSVVFTKKALEDVVTRLKKIQEKRSQK